MTTGTPPVHGPAASNPSAFRELPSERAAITGFAGRLAGHSGELGKALARWARRADGPDAEARAAANAAMDAIDEMARELYRLRNALGTEMRAHDDATARRTDELLAKPGGTAAAAEDDDAWLYR